MVSPSILYGTSSLLNFNPIRQNKSTINNLSVWTPLHHWGFQNWSDGYWNYKHEMRKRTIRYDKPLNVLFIYKRVSFFWLLLNPKFLGHSRKLFILLCLRIFLTEQMKSKRDKIILRKSSMIKASSVPMS